MTLLPILLAAVYFGTGNCSSKIVHGNFFLQSLSQNISITLLQISLKLHKHRGGYWRKKLRWMILEEQFPVPIYTAVSKIGNSVISLLWQLRCHCNPDHNKFSSLSSTTAVAIFSKLCLWRRSLCSNLGGIGPGKLYRATLNTHVFATTPNRPVSRRRRDHDGKVVSTSMRNIQQMMMSRPLEVAVAPKTSLS